MIVIWEYAPGVDISCQLITDFSQGAFKFRHSFRRHPDDGAVFINCARDHELKDSPETPNAAVNARDVPASVDIQPPRAFALESSCDNRTSTTLKLQVLEYGLQSGISFIEVKARLKSVL